MAQASDKKAVFISDSGDNVTSGAAGDLPLFVERLLSLNVKDAAVGGIIAPDAVARCREAGIGSSVEGEIGGKLDRVNGYPLKVKGKVMKLTGDGAVLRIEGWKQLKIILSNMPECSILTYKSLPEVLREVTPVEISLAAEPALAGPTSHVSLKQESDTRCSPGIFG